MKPPAPATENLEGLLRAIREEGVEAAKRESERIIAEARHQADEIISSAEATAEKLVDEARQRIEQQDESSRRSLEQAGRDLTLSVKADLAERLDRLIRHECGEVMNAEALERLLLGVAQHWMRQAGDGEVEVRVSERDRERLAATFVARLQEALKSGVELRAGREIGGGFRIGQRDGSMFYDFTDAAVAAALSELVNPRLAELFTNNTARAKEGRRDG